MAKEHEVNTILQKSAMQQQNLGEHYTVLRIWRTRKYAIIAYSVFIKYATPAYFSCPYHIGSCLHCSANRLRIVPMNAASFRINNVYKFFLPKRRICDSIYRYVLKFCPWM